MTGAISTGVPRGVGRTPVLDTPGGVADTRPSPCA